MTEEQRDNLLLSMNKKIEQRDDLLISLTKEVACLRSDITALDKKFEKKFEEQAVEISRLEQKFTAEIMKLDQKFEKKFEEQTAEIMKLDQKFEKKFEEQRLNIVKLENDLLDKIGALFDVREINNDKFNEHDEEFKLVNETLDCHNRRLLKLEKRFPNKKALAQ